MRRSHTLETEFTEEQRTLHDELLQFEYAALSTLHNARSVPFMMSTIRRQAASCIFGLAPYIRDIINRRFVQMNDDPDIDFDLEELDGGDAGTFSGMAKHILDLADNLPEDDPKFDSLLEIINQKQTYENNKIILFSTFRHTLAYLRKKLLALGLRVDQIDGSVKDDKRLELRQHFELPKENPDAIDILLFTEVGSEGLDYQFCDMMINYDLPWNPMKIEQRIGRIDRRGQKSEVVNIYNVITADTVDADIYYRCLMRIGIFEKSIGECEEILGEIGSQIEKLAVDTALTEDERRRKLEQIADNEVRKMQELSKLEDEEKELFGFDLSNYTTSKEIQKAESPWLTSLSIQKLVEKYLNDRLGLGSYIIGESDLKTLRLNASARYGYVFVDELGERMKPDYLTNYFPTYIQRHGIRKMRFHDLRHSCASLLLANGVPLKQIQEWLGHSDFSTTANIYAHLDYSSKISSAQAMEKGMLLPSSEGFESRWIDTEAEDAGEMSSNNEA